MARMSKKTLAALEASIAKWERNAKATVAETVETRADSCPLCDLFIKNWCRGCPVYLKTGVQQCGDTPWLMADYSAWDWRNGRGDAQEFEKHARAEVAFLKSLLPSSPTS